MDPQFIGPSGQKVPNQFSPHGEMVPNVPIQFGLPIHMVTRIFHLSRGTVCRDRKIGVLNFWGPFVMGTEFMRIVCPGGQELEYRKSGDQMGCSLQKISNILTKNIELTLNS